MADGSEDVNDFLQRIKELGDRRDQEDEERNRKLEEEILQGRKERQARRAERARSISPTKSSPSTTPTTSRTHNSQANNLSQFSTPKIEPQAVSEPRETAVEDAMARLTSSPTKENNAPNDAGRAGMDFDAERTPMKNSPSNAMPSRTPTLSWQQRPKSQASDRPRQRPLSVIATENASRSPRQTPEPTTAAEDTMSRDQIAQSLASKDPSWFRQTADRGLSSPAYRKNQVEDVDRAEHGSASGRVQMPGMSRSGTPSDKGDDVEDRATSSTRNPRSFGSDLRLSGSGSGLNSPLSLNPAQKLDPPIETKSERVLAMSPTQGRISPERLDRPPSPTKGLGGFVQSAMMKRSDSVSKRWSVQSPPGLHRGNSIASNRSSQDVNSGERGRESSPSSRPSSSHSNATITQERPGTSSSMTSNITTSTTDEGFVKPSLPASRSRSPTKASWLESALSKPESPKPKVVAPPPQPSWKAEIMKVKNKSEDLSQSPVAPIKHEVKVGGLLRSPPLGGTTTSPGVVGLPAGFSPSVTSRFENRAPQKIESPFASSKPVHNGAIKTKPETPPKKDFRSTLKSRQPPPDSNKPEEPEFKAAFGQLKRTKTQNYVAPDVLKDNINRGKSALNFTGGPVKTERKDEFREAILKKKDDFKAVQAEGKGVLKSASAEKQESPIPEALLKRQVLGRSGSITTADTSDVVPLQKNPPVSPKPPSLMKETSAPARLQGKEVGEGKLANRFNPALAGLLARGPPSASSDNSRSSSPATSSHAVSGISNTTQSAERSENGPTLTHMTKGRARGPRRKAPSAAVQAESSPSPSLPSQIDVKQEVFTPKKLSTLSDPSAPAAQALSKPIPSPKPSSDLKPSKNTEVEVEDQQPPSPRKLDLKRRSQFLQDVQSNKTEPLTPRPLSPVKTGNKILASMTPQSSRGEIKSKPETPVKSPSLSSKMSPKPQTQDAFKDRSIEKGYKPTPSSPSMTIAPLRVKSSFVADLKTEPSTPSRDSAQIGSSNSVRDAAAGWSKTPELPTRTKSPIKLPTHADEKAALIEAGLRSPSPEKPRPTIGLGIQSGVRPLPNPPLKSLGTPIQGARPVASNPNLAASTAASSPSSDVESAPLVLGFFTASKTLPKYTADTASILDSRPANETSIKTLRSGLFQMTLDGKKQSVPGHQERILFEGNLYFCTHTYGNAAGKKVSEAYYWIGDDVAENTADEVKLFAQREAKAAGANLVVVKQGKETSEFFSALGGIVITRRGVADKYDSLAPHMLCCRKNLGHIAFDEVDFSASSLCSGFAYLISTDSGKCYLWRGKGVHADELSCARLIGMDFGVTGDIEEVVDGEEPGSFITIFGPGARIPNSADHWKLKSSYNRYSGRLFLANDDKEQQITEISPYTQADLDPKNVYVLDAFFEIYIITGYQAQSQCNAFHNALTFAQEYGILAASMENWPRVPFTTIVMEGIPKDMKSLFRTWRDELSPTLTQSTGLQRGKSLRVVGLNAALEALRN